MLSLVGKLREVRAEIDAERAGIVLLALFEREDASGKWDIIFSATWIGRSESERPALDYFIGKLRPRLTLPELIAISRIVVFQPDEEFVQLVLELLRERGNPLQLANVNFNGMLITNAYIIAADLNYSTLPMVADIEAMQKQEAELLEAIQARGAGSSAESTQASTGRATPGRAVVRGRKLQAQ